MSDDVGNACWMLTSWCSHIYQLITGDLCSQTFSVAAVCWISYAFSKYLVLASVRQDFRLAELFLWLKNRNTFFDNFLQDLMHLGKNILLLYVLGMGVSVL